MDDTDLGRPPRHARPAVRRRDAKTMVDVLSDDGGEPVEEKRPCANCGDDVVIRIFEGDTTYAAGYRRRQLRGDVPVLCEKCVDEAHAAHEAEQQREHREKVIEPRVRTLPAKWRGLTFDDLNEDAERIRAFARAREWAAGTRRGLVLWGPVGRGKTAIAAAAANAWAQRRPLRWLPVAELLLDLRMPFDSPEYARAARQLEAAGTSAALVLDDLDKLKPSEHAVQPLYVAVNAWIEAELPLLVTLNRDLDELMEFLPETFGEAIASRLSGYCATVEVAGRDRRLPV